MIYSKTPELRQAEIATLVMDGGGELDPGQRQYIADRLGEIAARMHNPGFVLGDLNSVDVPEAKRITEESLRGTVMSHGESVAVRNELLRAYDQFRPAVSQLLTELKYLEDPREHPSHMGSGLTASVFRILHEGRDYAVRTGRFAFTGSASEMDRRAMATAKAKGVPHLEQIVALSYGHRVTISEIMPGLCLDHTMKIDDMKKVTDGQISELVTTVITAVRRGIRIDPKPTNILYDPDEGFGIIDIDTIDGAISVGKELGQIAAGALSNVGSYGSHHLTRNAATYRQELEWRECQLTLLGRYRDVASAQLNGKDFDEASQLIDKTIEQVSGQIDSLLNPSHAIERSRSVAARSVKTSGDVLDAF